MRMRKRKRKDTERKRKVTTSSDCCLFSRIAREGEIAYSFSLYQHPFSTTNLFLLALPASSECRIDSFLRNSEQIDLTLVFPSRPYCHSARWRDPKINDEPNFPICSCALNSIWRSDVRHCNVYLRLICYLIRWIIALFTWLRSIVQIRSWAVKWYWLDWHDLLGQIGKPIEGCARAV